MNIYPLCIIFFSTSQSERKLIGADFERFEEHFQINLPEEFKQHYLIYSGGYPLYDYVTGIHNIFTINGFNPIKYGSLPIKQIILDYEKVELLFPTKFPLLDSGDNLFNIGG